MTEAEMTELRLAAWRKVAWENVPNAVTKFAKALAELTKAAALILCLVCCAPAKNYSKGISVDVGTEFNFYDGVYPSAGISLPVAGTYISVGAWGGTDYTAWYWGQYLSWGYSWMPFEEED